MSYPKSFSKDKNEKQKQNPTYRRYLETASWIGGIIALIILVQQSYFPDLLKKHTDTSINKQDYKTLVTTTKDTSKKTKYNINAPVSNSAIGDNAVTNNYYKNEKVQRQLNTTDIKRLAFIDTSYKIVFWLSANNKEANNYAFQIVKYLKSKGLEVNPNTYYTDNGAVNNPRFGILKHINPKSVAIYVPTLQ
jgi:hypothetical protein